MLSWRRFILTSPQGEQILKHTHCSCSNYRNFWLTFQLEFLPIACMTTYCILYFEWHHPYLTKGTLTDELWLSGFSPFGGSTFDVRTLPVFRRQIFGPLLYWTQKNCWFLVVHCDFLLVFIFFLFSWKLSIWKKKFISRKLFISKSLIKVEFIK